MLRNELLQYAVLKFAGAINRDGFGRPASLESLSNEVREIVPDLTDNELMNVLFLLYKRQQLILHKFHGEVPYEILIEYHQFPMNRNFFSGQFLLLVTLEGHTYLEELEAKPYRILTPSASGTGPGSSVLSRLSYRSFVFTTGALVILAGGAYIMKLGQASSLLLLLLAVLVIARHDGLIHGLLATAIAAISLSVWFFPPIGSLVIAKPDDRLALLFFLLTASLGSRFFGERPVSVG